MDRKQLVVERTRAIFGERLDDVIHMVRQDRQDLRGWEEPAHVRAVLRRRTLRAGDDHFNESANVAVADATFSRGAGEPDPGQQRECLGQILEAGASALEKVARENNPDLTNQERLGLECVLLLHGRPCVEVNQDRLANPPPLWNVLEDQREDIEMAQRGVGRIELFGHPEYDWAGTAFLVNDTTLMTTRRTAEIFLENRNEQWQFRPGITAWMDYNSEYQNVASAGYRVRSIRGVHSNYDLALLEVEPPQGQAQRSPTPLVLAAQPPSQLEGRQVYLIGYPVRDARRNDPEPVTRIFRDLYNVKRIQPGVLRGVLQFRDVQLVQHDCAPLGQSSGSCLVDLETQQVLGIHLTSRYLEPGVAIPLWVLRDDPLLQRCGVTFAQATTEDLRNTTEQMERLARSRYWNEVRGTIATYYQRAFGTLPNNGNGPYNTR
jgi:Trypsin-like peptidase domain